LALTHRLDGFIESYFFKNREAYSVLQFFSETGENNANIKGNAIDTMLNKAISASSPHDRFSVYREIGTYIINNNIVIPLFTTQHASVVSICLTGTSENFLFNPYLDLPKISRNSDCNKLL
jgi:ABC-type oligopeptide transport system substrate-binding subunit